MGTAKKPENRIVSYRARWIIPIADAPLEGGYLTILGGRIYAVGSSPLGETVDLGDVAILPGFVNAHAHLDLCDLRGQVPTSDRFVDWLRAIVAYRRSATGNAEGAIALGVEELIRSGTTLLGDIATSDAAPRAAAQAGIRVVAFREVVGHKPERYEPLWQDALVALRPTSERFESVSGVSPHAPYSTSRSIYARCHELAENIPVATHWFESPEEMEFLRSGAGPMADFLREIGALTEPFAPLSDPWSLCSSRSTPRWLLVHGNCLNNDDMDRLDHPALRSRIAGFVYCPRTTARFSDRPHPWRELIKRGVPVALGTDSLASSPDLSVFEEARFLASQPASGDPARILAMLTRDGAAALQAKSLGTLQTGAIADLTVLALPTEVREPAAACLHDSASVAGTMVGGRWISLCEPLTDLGHPVRLATPRSV